MTQTLANYQETLNTLHFGQKAKHVKTTVNINEISQIQSGPEVEKAHKEINELKAKLKEYESKMMELQSSSLSKIDKSGDNTGDLMLIDDLSMVSTLQQNAIKEQEFTVSFLKDQLKFLSDRIK